MKGSDLKFLRENADMNKDTLSKLLDISLRTLISWEGGIEKSSKIKEDKKENKKQTKEGSKINGEKSNLGKPYILASRVIFESKLLKTKLQEIAKQAFNIAPSNYVSVWLVCSHELMLMKDVALHADFDKDNKFTNDEIRKSIRENSLFTFSIKNNEIINETKENIDKHPGKGKIERDTHYFKDAIFKENILLIPFVGGTDIGARPAVLLVLEDKIEKTDAKLYSGEEINKLHELLKNYYYNKGIGQICKALDYYSPLYCDYKI